MELPVIFVLFLVAGLQAASISHVNPDEDADNDKAIHELEEALELLKGRTVENAIVEGDVMNDEDANDVPNNVGADETTDDNPNLDDNQNKHQDNDVDDNNDHEGADNDDNNDDDSINVDNDVNDNDEANHANADEEDEFNNDNAKTDDNGDDGNDIQEPIEDGKTLNEQPEDNTEDTQVSLQSLEKLLKKFEHDEAQDSKHQPKLSESGTYDNGEVNTNSHDATENTLSESDENDKENTPDVASEQLIEEENVPSTGENVGENDIADVGEKVDGDSKSDAHGIQAAVHSLITALNDFVELIPQQSEKATD